MNWEAKIADKTYKGGTLSLTVEYSKGGEAFTEVIDLTGGDMQVAEAKVRDRLKTLNDTDVLASDLQVGTKLDAPAPAPSDEQKFVKALRRFNACTRAVALGLMTEKDSEYAEAKEAMISSYDIAFIDLI